MASGAAAAGVSGSAPAPAAGAAAAAFAAALRNDATSFPAEMPAPPRLAASTDPDAPHGRDETTGEPLAPHGFKSDGKPRIKPAGPGRGHTKDDRPQVTARAPRSAAAGSSPHGGTDYRAELAGFGMTVWAAGATLPPSRPYAHLFKQSLPGMVEAWSEAATENATVRAGVEKLAGEGSYAWVLKVSAATIPFLMGCWELARPMKATTPDQLAAKKERDARKAELANAAQAELLGYIGSQIGAALGDQELPAAA
jgi:hypothetical protein